MVSTAYHSNQREVPNCLGVTPLTEDLHPFTKSILLLSCTLLATRCKTDTLPPPPLIQPSTQEGAQRLLEFVKLVRKAPCSFWKEWPCSVSSGSKIALHLTLWDWFRTGSVCHPSYIAERALMGFQGTQKLGEFSFSIIQSSHNLNLLITGLIPCILWIINSSTQQTWRAVRRAPVLHREQAFASPPICSLIFIPLSLVHSGPVSSYPRGCLPKDPVELTLLLCLYSCLPAAKPTEDAHSSCFIGMLSAVNISEFCTNPRLL